MKFAFMSFSCPEATLAEMFDMAKKYGYEGIEPRAQAQHKHGVEIETTAEQRSAIRKAFADSGVECACIATSIQCCKVDKAKRAEQVELTKKFIALAADLGCGRLRIFGGKPDAEIPMEEAVKLAGEGLSQVKEAAEQAKVAVCMETHDHFMRADDCAKAVRIAESSFIRVNWDIMHPYTRGMTIEAAFGEVKDLVSHCHIHDGSYDEKRSAKLALMGEGEIPYRTAVQLLKSISYEGYLSGEYIKAWPPEVVLPHDVRALRSYL
jgi:sugar phosphate isomerase/epimerase